MVNNMLKLLIVDVDGTMTDGGIYYDEEGNELKKFSTKDAAGFFAAHQLGIKTMVLTGRKCIATTRRMEELKVDYLNQSIKDKVSFLREFMVKHDLKKIEVGYIGDDLNDYEPMKLCGYVGCPADAAEEVKIIADYISTKNGGNGVVRDIIEHYLKENNLWEKAISNVYQIGI